MIPDKMKNFYRPEIDGLRAIAVGSVIIYHADILIFGSQFFKGGFIGVDIFFVISGYLITSIMLKELSETGSISLRYFYSRRIRRILPVLTLVMLVSFPFAYYYLLPDNFINFSKSILFSLIFSSNFYFNYSGQVYDAVDSSLVPFLHTWSLSIEEQFYILFPIIILISFRYFRKYLYVERKNINLNFDQRKLLFKKNFKKNLYNLANNKKIILLYPSPISPTRVYDRVLKNKNKILNDKNFYLKDKINYDTSFYKKYNSEVISFFDSIKSDNINKIKLEKTFCPELKCFLYDNENVYIFDIAHPSYSGSVLINDLILKKIEFLELKRNR